MAAVTICCNFGAQESKVCHCFHCFPIYLPWSFYLFFYFLNFKIFKFPNMNPPPNSLPITSLWVIPVASKEPLDESKRGEWKVGLKFNIQKTMIMAAGPITSWQIDGETVSDFIFLGSTITADGNCSHEIKRRLLLGRKVMTNLDSILKSRDITLPTKVCLVKAMVFQWLCMDVRIGLWRKLSTEELMLLNCGVGEDSWESLGLQGDPTSPF